MQPRNILAIIDLVYYLPALLVSIVITRRHGFRKDLGWLCLVVLAIFRLAGASTELAASIHPTKSVITASIILQSFGLASLLLATQGLLMRLNTTLTSQYPLIPPRMFRLIHLPISAGIAVAIVGACYLGDSTTGNDSTGRTLQRAGILVLTGVLGLLAAINILFCLPHNRAQLGAGEKPILVATSISIPMLAIRLIFSLLVVFGVDPNVFSIVSQAPKSIVAEALMLMLEEFVIVVAYLTAGFMAPVLARKGTQRGPARLEEGSARKNDFVEETL